MKTHKVEITIEKNWELQLIKWEMWFSNWKAQAFEYTTLPPSSSVDCMDELAHMLKNVDLFNKKVDWTINKLEVTKIIT